VYCVENCYTDKCSEAFGQDSSFCNCDHGACIIGCEGTNCTAQSQCEIGCFGQVGSTEYCSVFCDDCLNRHGCWSENLSYATFQSNACDSGCYASCGNYLSSGSWFCNCSDHKLCLPGCEVNCEVPAGITTLASNCLTTCNTHTSTNPGCQAWCDMCYIGYNCWNDDDVSIGSEADRLCKTDCYDPCSDWLGAASQCSCSGHMKCVSGCPENCSADDLCKTSCKQAGLRTSGECDVYCTRCMEMETETGTETY
jgi:hypothetical protein